MGKHFFDFEDGDFAHSISDNMAIDSDGDLLMRMGDNMAMDMDSGELHIISGWSNDEDDESNGGREVSISLPPCSYAYIISLCSIILSNYFLMRR